MDESLKRPKNVKFYEFDKAKVDDEQIDLIQMLSMLFGVVAFLLKFKFSIWLSFTFFMANYIDQKMSVPKKKYLMNFGLIVMGFLLIYVFPS